MEERDFCLSNNKYNSVHIFVRLDIQLDKDLKAIDMIAPKD